MLKTPKLLPSTALFVLLVGPVLAAPQKPDRPRVAALAECFPAEVVAYAELPQAGDLFERAGLERIFDAAEARGLFDEKLRLQVEGGLALATLFAGSDALELAGHLVDGGVAVGLAPPGGPFAKQPHWGLIARGDDADLLEESLDLALERLAEQYDAGDQLAAPHAVVHGADLWLLGDDLCVARLGAMLLASNERSFLEGMLRRATGGEEDSLAQRAGFALPDGDDLALWLDREGAAAIEKPGGGLGKLTELVHLPQVQFLLGAGLAELAGSRNFSLGLDLSERGLALELVGRDPVERTGLAPSAAAPARRLEAASSLLGGLVYRDVASIVGRRNELFAPELQPKFNKALGDLALLFGGLEIDEDLLPAIGPWIEFGVAELDFGDAPEPDLALPGAVVLLAVAPEVETNLTAGFQTALGISNTERAQNGKPPFAMTLGFEGRVVVSSGHLPPPAAGEPIDADYNLAPACAFHDGIFVLGTHEALVRAALVELTAAAPVELARSATAPIEERVVLDGPALAALIAESREYLVMQAVLEEGKSVAEAEQEAELVRRIAGSVDHLTVGLAYPTEREIRFGLELVLDEALVEALGATSGAER